MALAPVEFHWKANTRPLHQTIDSIQATTLADLLSFTNDWLSCALGERDVAVAPNALDIFGDIPLTDYGVHLNRHIIEGVIARMTNNADTARMAFAAARAQQETIVYAKAGAQSSFCRRGKTQSMALS